MAERLDDRYDAPHPLYVQATQRLEGEGLAENAAAAVPPTPKSAQVHPLLFDISDAVRVREIFPGAMGILMADIQTEGGGTVSTPACVLLNSMLAHIRTLENRLDYPEEYAKWIASQK
jgi:hypothetical protein